MNPRLLPHDKVVLRSRAKRELSKDQIADLLSRWRRRELRLARVTKECAGLSTDQLEDIYQEATIVLLGRPYYEELHLLNALRVGMRQRALRAHRDRRRQREILDERAVDVQLRAHANDTEQDPEALALREADRSIIVDFLAELTAQEQCAFALYSKGLRYRGIAAALDITLGEAHSTVTTIEHKRERFQVLFDAGRLCGYRAQTIRAIKAGEHTTDLLVQRALAHLQGCPSCRREHKTTAQQLRQAFSTRALALLPTPALNLTWLARLALRARTAPSRLIAGHTTVERVATLLNSNPSVKLAAPLAVIATVAGGTIGTHLATNHHHQARPQTAHATTRPNTRLPLTGDDLAAPPAQYTPPTHTPTPTPTPTATGAGPYPPFSPGYVLPSRRRTSGRHRPAPKRLAHLAFAGPGLPITHERPSSPEQTHLPGGGGEFSP